MAKLNSKNIKISFLFLIKWKNFFKKWSILQPFEQMSIFSEAQQHLGWSWSRHGSRHGSRHAYFCSDPLKLGRNYILKQVFVVQTILADRYNHRRELWVESLKTPSSVEYGINFFHFPLTIGSYRGLEFCEY